MLGPQKKEEEKQKRKRTPQKRASQTKLKPGNFTNKKKNLCRIKCISRAQKPPAWPTSKERNRKQKRVPFNAVALFLQFRKHLPEPLARTGGPSPSTGAAPFAPQYRDSSGTKTEFEALRACSPLGKARAAERCGQKANTV